MGKLKREMELEAELHHSQAATALLRVEYGSHLNGRFFNF